MSVQTSTIQISTSDGAMPAFVAEPGGGGPHPVVVVLMEAFGLVAHIEDVSKRLAEEGYLAVAPDVYYRDLPDNKFTYDQLDGAIKLMQRVDDKKFIEDLRALISQVGGRGDVDASKIGITGFCMGGRLTFLAACELGDSVSAAAPFYGGGIAALLEKADGIAAPMSLFFGERDDFIPPDQVRAIDEKLGALGKDYTLTCYDGAYHGFFCDKRESYDAKAAADAWSGMLELFRENLR